MTRSQEPTAVDPTGSAWVVWVVLVAPLVLMLVASCLRRVGEDELLLVVRRRRVLRSRRSGFAVRWPGLDRFEAVPTGPQVHPLVVRARTRDDVDVVVLADVTIEVFDVGVGTDLASTPHPARLVEDALAVVVEGSGWATVVTELEDVGERWPGATAPSLPLGTVTTALVVSSVEARLTPGGPA